ncbi:UNVERIFIED_ORG: insecticidal toxin complex protein TccC [Pseudomonas putida]|nr:insecticidal toxin complex protein TccC [Pseudomonas putida]
MNNLGLHSHTPSLAVVDPRGLAVCAVAHYRSEVGQPAQPHISRTVFDPVGREVERCDPRLWDQGLGPNRVSIHSLSGVELLRTSVDAGWALALPGQAAQTLERWDSRSHQQRDYDEQLRPVAITERLGDEAPRVVERFLYGEPGGSARNQCGQLIRHDDPSTTRHMPDYDLRGNPLLETSHFLQSLEPVSWPADIEARDALLETASGLDSRWSHDALGEVVTQTDALLNRRRLRRTCAGQLQAVYLQRAGGDEVQLVGDIGYSAGGQVEQETAGNGVITRAGFRAEDARLQRLSAGLPGQPWHQDLQYDYDPVGNVVRIADLSKATRHFKNQRIDPVSTYGYDSRYRLVSATGREVLRAANDPTALVNYREEYVYDASDNPLELRHLGVQAFTRRWAVAAQSNRSLILHDGDGPPDFARAFDGNGNQAELLRGQSMHWDARNQLSQVTPVTREDAPHDTELYRYGGGGKRLRKVRCTLTSGRTVISEVRYLPGVEIHRGANGREHHVIAVEAGRNSMRLLHWVGPPPSGVDNDHLSYSLSDHLGSSLLELDERGAVLSDEGYLPFGGRAWWVAHDGAKAAYKTRGYSGKERDATGLYYYGYRYYAEWQQRWINPDPAGEVDGLNLYCFVGNSPLRYADGDGRWTIEEIWAAFEPNLRRNPEEGQTPQVRTLMAELDLAGQAIPAVADASGPGPRGALPVVIAPVGERGDATEVIGETYEPQPSTSAAAYGPWTGPMRPLNHVLSCSYCGKGFNRKKDLKVHRRTHTGEKPYSCPTCGKNFTTSTNLTDHIRTHTGEKPYSCGTCGKAFTQSTSLTIHLRTHTGEKPYTCTICSTGFARSGDLTVHKRIHNGEKPYSCLTCDMRFSQKNNLTKHKRRHHPGT